MRTNTNQHFVPQYYLRNFSLNNSINILDIKSLRIFKNSPKNIGHRKYFYDIDPKLAANFIRDNPLSIEFVDNSIRIYNENLLSPFIESFNIHSKMLQEKDYRVRIAVIDKYSLVDFILVQLYRTPKWLMLGNSVLKKLEESNKLKLTAAKKNNIAKTVNGIFLLHVLCKCNYNTKIEFKGWIKEIFITQQQEIDLLKNDIFNSLTVLNLNATEKLFITSDSPIGIKWHIASGAPTFEVIAVPINPRVAFLLINKHIFPQYQNTRSIIRLIKDDEKSKVENINCLTTFSSHKYLYNQSNDFNNEISFIKGERKLRIEL